MRQIVLHIALGVLLFGMAAHANDAAATGPAGCTAELKERISSASFEKFRRIQASTRTPLEQSVVQQMLENKEMPELQAMAVQFIEVLQANTALLMNRPGNFDDFLKLYLISTQREGLYERYRQALVAREADATARIIGNMTLEDVQVLMYGQDPLHPSPESLLGKYIAETGAQTIIRNFSTGPGLPDFGPQRLVVALSGATLPAYLKYFTGPNWFVHAHQPNQGTLYLAFRGLVGSYGQNTHPMSPQMGSIYPHVLLKTTEAIRFERFMSLEGNAKLTPWLYGQGTPEQYCAVGGYNSCTHWVGNIPIGDNLVNEYSFPGTVDQYASNQVGRAPVSKPLVLNTAMTEEIRRVWTAPGHEQLADVLGLREANLAGEFASPGYVAVEFTGRAPVGRVPVVFYVVQDHTQPIPPDFNLSTHAY